MAIKKNDNTNIKFKDEKIYEGYQKYLCNQKYFMSNKWYAPLRTLVDLKIHFPWHFRLEQDKFGKTYRHKYYLHLSYVMSISDNLTAPISSSYRIEQLSLLMPSDQDLMISLRV